MNTRKYCGVFFSMILLCLIDSGDLDAHRPFWSEGDHGDKATAFQVRDPHESIVVNHEATCDRADLWVSFEVEKDDEVFVQIGVPNIRRLIDYKLSAALIGPGLVGQVPLETDGEGGIVMTELQERPFFVDAESDTESYIYFEETLRAPKSGTYYVVAWPSQWNTGKFWITVGTEERFTDLDFPLFREWILRMKEFYEVDSIAQATLEECDPDDSYVALEESGCSISSVGSGLIGLFGVFFWSLFVRLYRCDNT